MPTFYDELCRYDWQEITARINTTTAADVRRALAMHRRGVGEFMALISPAAAPFLEEMAALSMQATRQRFGRTMQLYIPLYLSNYCTNSCVYCGFNCANRQQRKKLTAEELAAEVAVIKRMGYEHLLLVSGEAPQVASADYFAQVLQQLRGDFAQLALEVQPLTEKEYRQLIEAGLSYVCIYQETYNQERYPHYHPAGLKANFRYRLETPDRLGRAGVHKIGLAPLLGLEDWRTDSAFCALHLRYLEKTYWRTRYSISLPRLRPHQGGFAPLHPIDDREMVQLICAWRLFDGELEISISTRESRRFRDNIVRLGPTSMSAGSCTEPGGYASAKGALEQFAVHDDRSPAEIAAMLQSQGYEPVWKDWDRCLQPARM